MLEKIKNIIKLTTDVYLEKHLPRIPQDKKQIAINAYEKDIERLALFIYNSGFFTEDFLLTEDFIKGIHKSFYPEGFTQKGIDENGNELVWMIPGEYKKLDNFANTKEKIRFFSDLPGWTEEKSQYTRKELVEEEMNDIIINFNNDFSEINDLQKKKDLVFLLVLDIVSLHPFSDGNGRVVGILLDLYLEKLGFFGIGLKTMANIDKFGCDRAVFLAYDQRKPKYIYDFIEKMGGTI